MSSPTLRAAGVFWSANLALVAPCALPSTASAEVRKGPFAAWLGADGLSPGKAAADAVPSRNDA